jgi:tRNA 2-thiouridine synthesizing protein A
MCEEIDAIGLICPLPVLRLRKRMKALPAGRRVRLLATDPAAVVDVPHFCAEAGHRLIQQTQEGETLIFLIEKSA